MKQPIPGHIVRLLPAHGYAILLLDNAQEITVGRDCMPAGVFERLHVGDRIWYSAEPGEGPHTKHSGRVVPISVRYGANYGAGIAQSACRRLHADNPVYGSLETAVSQDRAVC